MRPNGRRRCAYNCCTNELSFLQVTSNPRSVYVFGYIEQKRNRKFIFSHPLIASTGIDAARRLRNGVGDVSGEYRKDSISLAVWNLSFIVRHFLLVLVLAPLSANTTGNTKVRFECKTSMSLHTVHICWQIHHRWIRLRSRIRVSEHFQSGSRSRMKPIEHVAVGFLVLRPLHQSRLAVLYSQTADVVRKGRQRESEPLLLSLHSVRFHRQDHLCYIRATIAQTTVRCNLRWRLEMERYLEVIIYALVSTWRRPCA